MFLQLSIIFYNGIVMFPNLACGYWQKTKQTFPVLQFDPYNTKIKWSHGIGKQKKGYVNFDPSEWFNTIQYIVDCIERLGWVSTLVPWGEHQNSWDLHGSSSPPVTQAPISTSRFEHKSHLSCFLGLQVGVFQNWNQQAPTNPFKQKAGATGFSWFLCIIQPLKVHKSYITSPEHLAKPDLRVNRSSHNFQILSEFLMHKMTLIFQKTLPAGRVFFLRVFFYQNKSLFLIKIRVFFWSK